MIVNQMREDMKGFMRSRDRLSLTTVRGILSAIKKEELSGSSPRTLSDAEVHVVLKREVKQRQEAAEIYQSNGESERAETEFNEISFIKRYLPKEMTSGELEVIISRIIEENSFSSMKDMGATMKLVNSEIAGRADGKTVSTMVKSKLV